MARSRSFLAVAGAIAVLTLAAGQAHAGQKCIAGAPGVGDTYYPGYGNGGYNVKHYDLDLAYDPATDVLEGRATIKARARQDLCSFNLDFVGLEVRAIHVDGRLATWTRSGQELTVNPRRNLKGADRFRARVSYAGVPVQFTGGLSGWMATPEGLTVAGQPEVAIAWFPANDHPSDKASYSFEVSVPGGYGVAANGLLRDVDRGPEMTTFRWEAREPMASYLATVDVADWDVDRSRIDGGLRVYDAVSSQITGELRAEVDSSLAKQGVILDLLSDAFGPYPFNTVGAIVPNQNTLFFALETQTRPVYGKVFWLDGQGNPVNGDFVVVHELAHQWFGDDVALRRWRDIWLNEGFATYAEWLWEDHEGRATPQELFQALYDEIPADDPFWSVEIGDPGTDLLFDIAVYERGAMTLQALRNEIGDSKFWRIVRRWAASRSGGLGTTRQFIRLAERIAGQDLDDLFDTWLFTGSKPPPGAVAGGTAVARLNAREQAAAADWQSGFEQRIAIGAY